MGNLVSAHSILFYMAQSLFSFLGKTFGGGGEGLMSSCLEMLHINLILKTTLNDINDLSMCLV